MSLGNDPRDPRGYTRPFGGQIYVPLGMADAEFRAAMERGESLPVSNDPDWHSHPLLGITGHLHPEGTRLHGHMPEWTWGPAVLIAEPVATEATP